MTTLFAVTLFGASFLMFVLEPMVGRTFLPRLGGAPVVWNTCLVFFQAMLLAGYAFVHGLHRYFTTIWQAAVFGASVVIALVWLPTSIVPAQTAISGNSVTDLLVALVAGVGLPFFVLASVSSGLQRWFSITNHTAAADPYFLYAVSNAGSLLGLLAYPIAIEPRLALQSQVVVWRTGFGVFAALALTCSLVAAVVGRRDTPSHRAPRRDASDRGVGGWNRFAWVALSAVPASLLIGITTFLTTDLAPFPLLWVGPLALYLLTFVIAFAERGGRLSQWALRAMPVLVALFVLVRASDFQPPLWAAIVLHLVLFVTLALACHGRLAHLRPAASHLTEFYLWIALGGMLGGLFNALVAPMLFKAVAEYPFAVACACVAPAFVRRGEERQRLNRWDLAIAALAGGCIGAGILIVKAIGLRTIWLIPILVFVVVGIYTQKRRPLRFALSIGSALFSAALVYGALDRSLHRERTFFGTYRVRVTEGESFRRLLHGTTLHGAQSFEPDRQHLALTYYSAAGPVGQLFDRVDRLKRPGTRIGAVGLGVGSIAAYVGAGQELTFFELDPAVERIARTPTLFTHLDQCGSQCRVVVGDARLSLQRSTDTYALIVLDAFSSDAIPIHLLTREAFVLYLAHLTPDGILAVHVSNRHLNLVPIVARLAEHTGLFMLYQAHSPTSVEREAGIAASTWAVLATNPSVLDALRVDVRWSEPERIPSTPLWTDDFSNILSALKIPFFRS